MRCSTLCAMMQNSIAFMVLVVTAAAQSTVVPTIGYIVTDNAARATVLVHHHDTTTTVRITGKRFADKAYTVLLSATPCSQPIDIITNSSFNLRTEGFGRNSHGQFLTAAATFQRTRISRSITIVNAGCANLGHARLQSTAYLVEMSEYFRQKGDTNAWPLLTDPERETTLQQIKTDATKWMPAARHARRTASTVNATFALVCKNAVREIEAVARAVEASGELFADYRVIAVESGSTDGTDSAIVSWGKRNGRVKAAIEKIARTQVREENIANARNVYIDIYKTPAYGDSGHLIVVDCDFAYGWEPEIVSSCFAESAWGGCCGNGVAGVAPYFYHWDMYALRTRKWPVGYNAMRDVYGHKDGQPFTDMMVQGLLYDAGDAWEEATSCFGGLAIYERNAISGCSYSGRDITGAVDCEHVHFNECIRANNYTLFINPAAFIRYPVTESRNHSD